MEIPHSDTSSVDSSAINKASQSSAKWVRFDDTVSVETTLTDPSTSDNSANGADKPTSRPTPHQPRHSATPLANVAQIDVELEESRRPFTFFGQGLMNKKTLNDSSSTHTKPSKPAKLGIELVANLCENQDFIFDNLKKMAKSYVKWTLRIGLVHG